MNPVGTTDHSEPEIRPELVAALLSVAGGWLLSGLLLLRGFSLVAERTVWGGPNCSGCDEVLATASHQLGFPLAAWGFVYFALIGFLLATGQRLSRAALLLASAALGVSLVLTAALLISYGPKCGICLAVHAMNLLLFVALWRLAPRPAQGEVRSRSIIPAIRRALPVVAAMLLGGSLQATLLRPGGMVVDALREYESATPHNLALEKTNDPTLGRADAGVQVVVFSSFQCPACKSFARLLHDLRRGYGDAISVTFKHFPLGRDCNPLLKAEIQPRACAAAYAAEAAKQQQAFWRYHDGLFDSSLLASEEMLLDIAKNSGLDQQRWQADRQSQTVRAKVMADVALGVALRISGTPAVFVNGRQVTQVSRPVLRLVIARELDKAKKDVALTR